MSIIFPGFFSMTLVNLRLEFLVAYIFLRADSSIYINLNIRDANININFKNKLFPICI
jgi:hypothetical protein